MRYAALLRGINVGGANKVDMKQLQALFEEAGMASVRTYINSGNVVFSASRRNRAALARMLEKAIEERFGFRVDVLVLDRERVRSIVAALPADWRNDQEMKCDVLFLWEDVDRPSIVDDLHPRTDLEDVRYVPGAVVWRIDRKNVTKSRLPRIVGTPLYKRVTIRNCNTARRLLELMDD